MICSLKSVKMSCSENFKIYSNYFKHALRIWPIIMNVCIPVQAQLFELLIYVTNYKTVWFSFVLLDIYEELFIYNILVCAYIYLNSKHMLTYMYRLLCVIMHTTVKPCIKTSPWTHKRWSYNDKWLCTMNIKYLKGRWYLFSVLAFLI